MASPVYRSRTPKASPLWQCLFRHFDAFLGQYEEYYRKHHGLLRPIIEEVVNKFLDCGDLEHGFARIRRDHCKKDHFLAVSCKGRWFCPSCHQKKVQLFGALLAESILYPVPHRHYTLGIPKMLRPYFRYNRDLLKQLCRIALHCMIDYQREMRIIAFIDEREVIERILRHLGLREDPVRLYPARAPPHGEGDTGVISRGPLS